jgi:hypothetical protein
VQADPKVDAAEEEFRAALGDAEKLRALWRRLDYNGNGKVSLAELTKFIVCKRPTVIRTKTLCTCF